MKKIKDIFEDVIKGYVTEVKIPIDKDVEISVDLSNKDLDKIDVTPEYVRELRIKYPVNIRLIYNRITKIKRLSVYGEGETIVRLLIELYGKKAFTDIMNKIEKNPAYSKLFKSA